MAGWVYDYHFLRGKRRGGEGMWKKEEDTRGNGGGEGGKKEGTRLEADKKGGDEGEGKGCGCGWDWEGRGWKGHPINYAAFFGRRREVDVNDAMGQRGKAKEEEEANKRPSKRRRRSSQAMRIAFGPLSREEEEDMQHACTPHGRGEHVFGGWPGQLHIRSQGGRKGSRSLVEVSWN
jgi:hypothetical protein